MKIVSHLMSHFLEILPRGDGELYSLGLFLGRNIQFISPPGSAAAKRIVPEQVYGFMKKKAVFERAIGRGVGENFELLDEPLQESILEFVDTEIEFGVGLADSLGERFIELDDSNRERVLDKIYHGMLFARYFGQSAGRLYGRLSGDLRTVVMSHAEKNPQFADGLGMGLGYTYATLEPELQQEITRIAQKSFEISRGLGFGFGFAFGLLQEQDAKKMEELADKSSELDTGFGMGLAAGYANLSKDLRRFVIDRVEKDCLFAFGAGIYAAFVYRESVPGDLFSLLGKNGEVAYGLGLGFGTSFFYLSTEFQSKLQALLKNDAKLDDGMGTGIGLVLQHLPPEAQEMFIHKASASNAFATGLGYGFGFTWHYIGDALRKRALVFAGSNNDFARGLGIGMGRAFTYLTEDGRAAGFQMADKDMDFAAGLGEGIGAAYSYLEESQRRLAMSHAEEGDTGFSRGLGTGLGSVFSYLEDAMKNDILVRAAHNGQLSTGLGVGLGWRISYLPEAIRTAIFGLAKNNPRLAAGLGEGCGLEFPRLSPAIRDWLSLHADMGDFGFGLGVGIGKIRRQIGEGIEKEAAAAAGKKMGNEFSEGLAIGFAGNPTNLSDDGLLSKFLSGAQTDADFAKSFGFGLGRIFSMLEGGKRGRILETMGGNEGFFAGLGEGMGHHLPSTGSRAVEELMRATRSASLERGLAGGIAASFRHRDLPEVLGVLEYAGSSPEYGRALGKDLAETFASFDEDRQSLILDAVQKDSEFSRQFSAAIEKNMPYVSAQMRERVKSMKAKLPHLQGAIEQEGIEKRGKKTRFEHIPAVGMSARGRMNWNVGNEEIAFSGKVQKCCVCFIDMVGSTKISSDLTAAQLSRYYEIFLNTIARIAGNFGAKIVKNAGDALIFYFDSTELQGDPGKSTRNFKNVLDCCLTMGMVSGALNAKMLSEKLPPVQYRISADYGEVSVAKSSSSQSEDLFGPAMNICAKVNSKARPNGLVIGQTLFEQVKELDEYTFAPSAEKLVGLKGEYEVYHVDEKEKTSVINPFERRAIE
jgi:class 3 adenylate cyclase